MMADCCSFLCVFVFFVAIRTMAKKKVDSAALDSADGVRVGEEPVPGMRLRCICRETGLLINFGASKLYVKKYLMTQEG